MASYRRNFLYACASLGALTWAAATPAFAAPLSDAPIAVDTVSAVEVNSGTNIPGVASVGSPVETIGRAEMQASGLPNVGDMVHSVPAVLTIGADEGRIAGAQDAAANTTRISGVNLRGIGNEATLVLFNGRRLAPNGVIKSLADANQIPSSAVERIEIVTDGASAVYGSDAVAGVFNIISRRNFNGAETRARYGEGDGVRGHTLSQTFGRTWEGGSLFFAAEQQYRSRLRGADRPFVWQDRTARGGSDARSFFASPGNITITPTGGSAVRYPLPAGTGAPGTINTATLLAGAANRFDESRFADALPQQKRDSFLFNVNQRQGSINFWLEGFYTRHQFDETVAPASGTLRVGSANPYYVAPLLANLPAGVLVVPNPVSVEYRFLAEDFRPRIGGNENSYQVAVGFDLDVNDNLRVSGYADINRDTGFQNRGAVLNNNLLNAALARTTTATAFNPFGNGSTNTGAAFAGIIARRDTSAINDGYDLGLKLTGSVFTLPAGDVRMALGVEHHGSGFEQRLVATNTSTDGSETVKLVTNDRQFSSVFVEFYVPLFGDPNTAAGSLALSLAARYDRYSDFGGTTNPKIGIVWQPIEGLTFRGTYGTSFRAPSLVDTSPQIHNIFVQTTIPDPTVGSGVTTGIFHNGGRAGLKPEEATTWSGGVDWRPSFIDGLTLSVSYYRIEYTDRIDVALNTALTSEAFYAPLILRRPAAGDVAGNAAFDALVNAFYADPDLQSAPTAVANIKVIIDGRRANLGTLRQDGVEFSGDYRFTTSVGDFNVGLSVAKILNLTRQASTTAPFVDVLDTFNNPVSLRWRGNVGWRGYGFSANAFLNVTGGYNNTAVTPNVRVKQYRTVDTSLAYDFGEGPLDGVRIALNAQNVFDQDPPVVLNGALSWDSQNASALGRFVSVEVVKRW